MYQYKKSFKEKYSLHVPDNMLFDIGVNWKKREMQQELCDKYNIDVQQLYYIGDIYDKLNKNLLLSTQNIKKVEAVDNPRYITRSHYTDCYFDRETNTLVRDLTKESFPKEVLLQIIKNCKREYQELYYEFRSIIVAQESNGEELSEDNPI